MNCLANSFSFFFCSIFSNLHSDISFLHSTSIPLSNFITFQKSSMASSQAFVNFLACPLRQIFLALAESEAMTWLAKVITISYFLALRQQRERLEQAGRMMVLSISAISFFRSFCCRLFLRMYSKVITAFENSLVALSQSFWERCLRPKSQHSWAILRCLTNYSCGDYFLFSLSSFISSSSAYSNLSRSRLFSISISLINKYHVKLS